MRRSKQQSNRTTKVTSRIPEGYSVDQDTNGRWRWSSILAPECHARSGFRSRSEAIEDCREANPQ